MSSQQMPEGPAAQSTYRVPRTYLDDLYPTSQQSEPTRMTVGVVTSVGATTCCVFFNEDEDEVCGIVFQGDPPAVGDVVEIEQRGDLWVIPADNDLDAYVEGIDTAVHIVSDDDPGTPPEEDVPIGGGFTDTESWYFVPPDVGNWTRAYGPDGGIEVTKTASVLVATNYIPNPNAEGDTGWVSSALFGGATPAAVEYSTEQFASGTRSVKATWPDLTPGTTQSNLLIQADPVPPGVPMCMSIRVYVPSDCPDVRPDVTFHGAGGPVTLKDEWTWAHVEFTSPTDGTAVMCGVSTEVPVAGTACYVDTCIVREGSAPGPDDLAYFDGATPDAGGERFDWLAAANASSSTRTKGQPDPVPPGTLWSFTDFEVDPGDVLHLEASVQYLAQATVTVEPVVAWGPEDSQALPDATSQVIVYPPSLLVDDPAAPETLTADITVPDEVTVDVGPIAPRRARVGFRLTPTGNGLADLLFTAATLTRSSTGWPLGSIWFDPGADVGGITTFGSSTTSAVFSDMPSTTAWTPVPGMKKAILTAPPTQGGIIRVNGYLTAVLRPSASGVRFALRRDNGELGLMTQASNNNTLQIQIPINIEGLFAVGPGESIEVAPVYSYAAATTALDAAGWSTISASFFPGAVFAGTDPGDPMIRYWDGDSWRPTGNQSASMDMTHNSTEPPVTKPPTTTALTISSGPYTEGQKITLTATITPTNATGTVTFYRSNGANGPWTSLGSTALPTGTTKVTKTWTAVKGSWYFRAHYGGSSTYAASEDKFSNPRTVQGQLVTKTQTLTAAWQQGYNGNGGQKPGNNIHQGYNPDFPSTGNTKGLVRFQPNLPADAEIVNVEFTVRWDNWNQGANGVLVLGWHEMTNKPNSYSNVGGYSDRSRHAIGKGLATVNLTWAESVVTRNDFKGIRIGPGPTQATVYTGFTADGADHYKLKITYRTRT